MESVMKKTAATSLLASCAVSLALFSSCASQEQNTLTPEEIADGWVLLFEGKTLDGWKDYNGTTLTQPWHVVDGCIQAKGDGSDACGRASPIRCSLRNGAGVSIDRRAELPGPIGRVAEIRCGLRNAFAG